MDGESVEDGREISVVVALPAELVRAAIALPAEPVRASGRSHVNPYWWAGRKFMHEFWRCGEPELRHDYDYVLLQCTPGVDALEAQYHGLVSLVVVV